MGAENLELGPCQVKFGTDGSETDLGLTEGGVEIEFATQTVDLMSDQTGQAPQDRVIVGQTVMIRVPLAEITMDNWATALNQTKKHYSGSVGVPGANLVGTSLLNSKAQSLVLIKYVDGSASTDSEDYFKFAKAAPTGNFTVSFSRDGQRVMTVEFVAFLDTNSNLYMIGDEDACEQGS